MIGTDEADIMKNWKRKDPQIPLVSVLCYAYNQQKYITRTLEGILMQKTDFPFEIIVHDDASADRTAKIIKQYERKFPHIVFPVYEKENQYSKKDGSLERSAEGRIRGKYTAYCEGDDYWIRNDKLQKQVDFLEKNPEYTCIYHPVYYVKDGRTVSHKSLFSCDRNVTADEIIAGGGSFCITSSLCFRSQYLYEKWNFKKFFDVGDYPMQVILGIRGKVRYMHMMAACYRTGNEDSWSSRISSDKEMYFRHMKTGIKAMIVLNKETERKYEKSIFYRISLDYLALWGAGYDCQNKFWAAAKKTNFYYRKKLIRLYVTGIIKKIFKWLNS